MKRVEKIAYAHLRTRDDKLSARERGAIGGREGDAPAEESHDPGTGQHAAQCVENVSVGGVDHLLVEDKLRRKKKG